MSAKEINSQKKSYCTLPPIPIEIAIPSVQNKVVRRKRQWRRWKVESDDKDIRVRIKHKEIYEPKEA